TDVVDEVVDPAERVEHRLDRLLLVGGVVRLPGHEDGAVAQPGRSLRERFRIPSGDADPVAPRHQGPCDAEPDSAARAGDDRGPDLRHAPLLIRRRTSNMHSRCNVRESKSAAKGTDVGSYGLTIPLSGLALHEQRDLIGELPGLGYTDV